MDPLLEFGARQAMMGEAPLAERMRPEALDGFVGQSHIMQSGGVVREAMVKDRIFSMILWGPAGCGKTTLARMIASKTRSHFVQFSAVLSGVKDIRDVVKKAKEQQTLHRKRTILFVDEIHRFNKAQQDAFLHYVESGLITLIGATTENPSFEVISPLLSRCRVIVLQPVSPEDMAILLDRALNDRERGLGRLSMKLESEALDHLIRMADGDARMALNSLEIAAMIRSGESTSPASGDAMNIRLVDIEQAIQKKALTYDKGGEEHYNLISALHKSLRGSDPDAALYWLARMLSSGEDPLYIARRMVRFAAEDVGIADPQALGVALAAVEAYRLLGSPEGELAIAEAVVFLATAPKSNSVYRAWSETRQAVREHGSLPVPLHIRNAPTRLMKEIGYGDGYRYAHDYPDGFVPQDYLPPAMEGTRFYHPTDRGYEKTVRRRLEAWRSLRKGSKSPGEPT